jgi:hypothetical protein
VVSYRGKRREEERRRRRRKKEEKKKEGGEEERRRRRRKKEEKKKEGGEDHVLVLCGGRERERNLKSQRWESIIVLFFVYIHVIAVTSGSGGICMRIW